jgi:hypothetical protein
LQPPDIPAVDVWHIYQANIVEVSNSTRISTLLAQQTCQA